MVGGKAKTTSCETPPVGIVIFYDSDNIWYTDKMATFSFSDDRNRLLQSFAALAPSEQEILELVSVIYEPISTADIIDCFRDYQQRSTSPATKSEAPPSAILRRLQQQLLLTWNGRCNPLIREIVSRKAQAAGRFILMAAIVRSHLPLQDDEPDLLPGKRDRHLREMRIGLYTGDFDCFNHHLLAYYECPGATEQDSPLPEIVSNPFEPAWFSTLPPHLQLHCLHEISTRCLRDLQPFDSPLAYLREKLTLQLIPEPGWPAVYYLRILHLLLRGERIAAEEEAKRAGTCADASGMRGWLLFLKGSTEEANAAFRSALRLLRENREDNTAFFAGCEGLIYLLTLLQSGDFTNYAEIITIVSHLEKAQPANELLPAYRSLAAVAKAKTESFCPGCTVQLWNAPERNGVASLFVGLGTYWLNGVIETSQRDEMLQFFRLAKENGFAWLAMEYATLLEQVCDHPELTEFSSRMRQQTGITPLLAAVPHEKTWQRALKALNLVSRTEEGDRHPRSRLAWLVEFRDGFLSLEPREQKMTTKGNWGLGRTVSLKRLCSGEALDFMTDQDRKVRAALRPHETHRMTSFTFDMDEALPALIGHPLLFSSQPPHSIVEFIKGEPQLRATIDGDHLRLTFTHPIGNEKVLVLPETPTRFSIITISPKQRRIINIIGDDGLRVPLSAKNEVLTTLGNLSSCLTIHSDIDESAADIEKVSASARIIIQLLPVGTGFRISFLVRPFIDNGPYLHPGEGAVGVITEINGRRLQALRNLQEERDNCQRIESLCPTLARLPDEDWEWLIDDIQDCLEALVEIEMLGDMVNVEWPEGQRLAIRRQVTFSDLHLHIRQKKNWFELDAALTVSPDLILDMKQLLEASSASRGRFIPLGQGGFLALSRELRRQLDELDSYTEETKSGRRRIHPLAAGVLDQVTENGGLISADSQWQERLQRMRAAHDLDPEIPSTLQAELRRYQIEGFKWLSRLHHWGVGACLADDMGLGKTVQTLGIILREARNGPSLVVAPTSVCMNWEEEIRKFTPTLNGVLFGGKERADLIAGLGPFDVAICSYGLLQQEHKLLATREWQVIVLDEAQAIKNIATKRSRAAMELKGHFRMITTGTPIENHLGELWNLFHFINPGLLGSLDHFNRRFAVPIEKEQDDRARKKLKKLIQPFILRRLKSQVLEELPPRTEVILHVDMTREEAAFYEALRRHALETIERQDSTQPQRHMQILAEIMKLRLACCNPRLIVSDSTVHCSKLELFGTIIRELIENRHKALVFSQFSSHLRLIRAFLDELQISCKYLDGSTPARKRQEQVADFQAGDGDVFLISLKAGGLGLNLTAADYVIHMDPWWNPAVEDQASDRAHRIGQLHPVTVYRLITRNTIEEKILALHRNKRELADTLLEGSDRSHRLSLEALLALLNNDT